MRNGSLELKAQSKNERRSIRRQRGLVGTFLLILAASHVNAQTVSEWEYEIKFDRLTQETTRVLSLPFKVFRVNGSIYLGCSDSKLLLFFVAGRPAFADSQVLYKIDDGQLEKLTVTGTARTVTGEGESVRRFARAMMTGKTMILRPPVVTEFSNVDITIDLASFRAKGSGLIRACRIEDDAKRCAGFDLSKDANDAEKTRFIDTAIQKSYDDLVKEFVEKVLLRQIVVGTEREAKAIIAQISNGASFEVLFNEKSTDKYAGGYLSFWDRKKLSTTFGDEAWSTADGDTIKKPFKGENGWRVVQVVRRSKPWPKFEEVKEQLKRDVEMDIRQCRGER